MKGHVGDGAWFRGSLGSGSSNQADVCMSFVSITFDKCRLSAPEVRYDVVVLGVRASGSYIVL